MLGRITGRNKYVNISYVGLAPYSDTDAMTCDNCPEPMTDTFAFYEKDKILSKKERYKAHTGHIHKNLGEYCGWF